MHRDIKPENVVVGADGVARICDFGLTEHVGQNSALGIGSLPYLAPELFVGEVPAFVSLLMERQQTPRSGVPASFAHDVWAAAITIFAVITDQYPWATASVADVRYVMYVTDKPGVLACKPWCEMPHPLVEVSC